MPAGRGGGAAGLRPWPRRARCSMRSGSPVPAASVASVISNAADRRRCQQLTSRPVPCLQAPGPEGYQVATPGDSGGPLYICATNGPCPPAAHQQTRPRVKTARVSPTNGAAGRPTPTAYLPRRARGAHGVIGLISFDGPILPGRRRNQALVSRVADIESLIPDTFTRRDQLSDTRDEAPVTGAPRSTIIRMEAGRSRRRGQRCEPRRCTGR